MNPYEFMLRQVIEQTEGNVKGVSNAQFRYDPQKCLMYFDCELLIDKSND